MNRMVIGVLIGLVVAIAALAGVVLVAMHVLKGLD